MKTGITLGLIAILLVTILGCSDDATGPGTADPTIDSFVISGGSMYTISRDVMLDVTASDNTGLNRLEVRLSEDPDWTGVDWEAYDAQMPLTLSEGDGTKTVYGQVRDLFDNLSATASAEIVLAENSTVVHFNPDRLTIPQGETRTVEVEFVNAQSVSSARLEVRFDPTVLEVKALTVDVGPNHILRSTGAYLIVSDQEFDNDAGYLIVGALGQQDGFSGVTGDGPFATIEFMAKTAITSPISLTIEEYDIYNYSANGPPELAGNVFVFEGEVQ